MGRDYFEVHARPRLREMERVVWCGRLTTDPLYYQLLALAAKDCAFRVLLNPLVRLRVQSQVLGGQRIEWRGAWAARMHLQGLSAYALHSMAHTALHILFLRTFLVSALHNDYPSTPRRWARKVFLASLATAAFVETATYPLLKIRNAIYAGGPLPRPRQARSFVAQIYAQGGLRGFYHGFSLSFALQMLHCFAASALLCQFNFGLGLDGRVSAFLATSVAGAVLFPLDTLFKRAQSQRADIKPGAYLRSLLSANRRNMWRGVYSGLPHFLVINAATNAFFVHKFKLANFSRHTLE